MRERIGEALTLILVISSLVYGLAGPLRELLGMGIVSVTAGWLLSCIATVYALVRAGLGRHSRGTFMIYGIWLVFIAMVAVLMIGLIGADLQLALQKQFSALDPSTAEADALRLRSMRVDALLDSLKNLFIMVSAALGASAVFAAMTVAHSTDQSP